MLARITLRPTSLRASSLRGGVRYADWWILNLVLTSLLFACVVLTIQKGVYATDVREPRTATGSRIFPLLARFCPSQRTGKTLVGRLWLDVTNVMASKRSKKENFDFRLPSVAHERLLRKLPKNGGKGSFYS